MSSPGDREQRTSLEHAYFASLALDLGTYLVVVPANGSSFRVVFGDLLVAQDLHSGNEVSDGAGHRSGDAYDVVVP